MEPFLQKYTLTVYWVVLVLDCIFLYFDLPYVAVTSSLLVPLLLLYLFIKDANIGRPTGKFFFYIGLFLAFLGDVLQIAVKNEVFFFSSLIIFMLMNLCYSICFFSLNKLGLRKPFPVLATVAMLSVTGYVFVRIMGEEMGEYLIPVIVYMITLIVMVALAINVAANPQYYTVAIRYFLPGSLVFILQNAIFAFNLFGLEGNASGFIYSVIPYAIGQYLMAKGILKVYL